MHTLTRSLIASLAICSNTYAVGFQDSRAGKWSMTLMPVITNSSVIKFDNGAEADLSKHSGFTFGFGYNFNLNFELAMLFNTTSGNYTGVRVKDDGTKERFSANMYTSRFDVDLTYNLLKQNFTPYVDLFMGSTYIDSGIPTGNITSGCWYDPWYGPICAPVAETYTANRFDYGVGAGLRYDFNRQIFIKGGVTQTFIDIDNADTPDFIRYQFGVGFMF